MGCCQIPPQLSKWGRQNHNGCPQKSLEYTKSLNCWQARQISNQKAYEFDVSILRSQDQVKFASKFWFVSFKLL